MVGSTFITDAANSLDAWINEGVQELHELLAEKFDEDYLETSATFTTVAGTEAYNLPSDFYKLLGVDLTLGSQVISLQPYRRAERSLYKAAVGGPTLPRYKLTGSQLRLLPAPDSAYAGRYWYIPTKTLLVNGSDEINFPNGWERYVVLRAAITALKKEESETASLENELALIRQDIERRAEQRDPGAPHKAVDVEAVAADPRTWLWE